MKPLLYSALPTPFDDMNKIDLDVMSLLLKRLASTHDGLVIAGSTGEGESLTVKELQILIDFFAPFKLDKILAINEDITSKVVTLIESLDIPSEYSLLLRVPAYVLPTQEGIYKHYKKIFDRYKNYNFIIYNIPKRTGSRIELDTLKRLKDSCNNLIAIKDCTCEEHFVREATKFIRVFSGVDIRYVDYLSWGASGLISVDSLLYPQVFFQLGEEYYKGNINASLYDFINLNALKNDDAPNPIPLKRNLKKLGYKSMNLRLPLCY